MNVVVTPKMIETGTEVFSTVSDVPVETLVERVYRAMAAAAPADSVTHRIAELEAESHAASALAQAQRERIEAADDLLQALRSRVAQLEETYLGPKPQPI